MHRPPAQDGSGTIAFQTFQMVMATKMQTRDPREEAIKAFRLFDDDETGAARAGRIVRGHRTALTRPSRAHAGTISLKNLRRVAKELGENMTDEELQARALPPPPPRAPA